MNFNDRLLQLRKSAGYSRVEFAEKIGIPHTTLRNYETGVREPGHLFLIKMAEEFNVSVDYLLGISSYPEIEKSPTTTKAEAEDLRLNEIIECWGELNEDGRESLHNQVIMHRANPKYKKRTDAGKLA